MSSQVLTGSSVLNPAHPNIEYALIGGMFETWSPVRLTNYTIDAYGGPGTVEITGASSLVNSTLEMTGPNDNLLNEGLMTLVNSQLAVNGSVAGSGMVLATGGSTVTVSSSTPINDTYSQPLTKQETSDLASAKPELISLKSSTLNIEGAYTGSVVMDAASTVNVFGTPNIAKGQTFGIYATGPLGKVNLATGSPTIINGGVMQIGANLNIDVNADPVYITNGGRLILGGFSTGNTIAITSGTLEFAQTPGFLQSPETASDGFNTKLAFTGSSGSIQFDGTSQIGPLIEHFTPTLNEIAVFNQGHILANIQLAPSASPYSASEFSVHGNTLVFHHS